MENYTKNFNYFFGFLLVFFAGLFWSFGVLTVRYMNEAQNYVFHYLFIRGFSIAFILIFFLFIKEGTQFYKNFLKINIASIIGAIGLATAFTGFIFSITMTTAAVTLFMLAVMPFIAGLIAYFIIGEKLRKMTLISMIIAFIGVAIMILNQKIGGGFLGALLGFLSATGFAIYTVSIRWKPSTPKFTTIVLAGIFCAIFSFFIILVFYDSYHMPSINAKLSLLHGCIVASGLILYSFGAKYLPSAELALLSLMEVVGGILWVWLPIFGINEIPSFPTIIGGLVITFAVILHGIGSKRKRMPVTS